MKTTTGIRTSRGVRGAAAMMIVAAGVLGWTGAAAGVPLDPPAPLPIERSSGAFPKIKLGGVKSKAPRAIGSVKGSLLPPVPTREAAPDRTTGGGRGGRSVPGVIVGDREASRGDRQRDEDQRRGDDDTDRPPPRGVSGEAEVINDRLRLRARLGSGFGSTPYGYGYVPYGYGVRRGVYGSPYSYSTGGYGYRPYGYGYGYGWYEYPPEWVIGYRSPAPSASQPVSGTAAAEPIPARAVSPLEAADESLRAGRSADAVAQYRDYLRSSPEDAQAMRSLALALILEQNVREGIALMQYAYERHPTLATTPVQASDVPREVRGQAGLRSMLLAVVPVANKTKSASGYLTEVVLMQAQGRTEPARRMLARAAEAGLAEATRVELHNALAP